ncbi:HAD family hydrolase [Planctomicrobium sp. SH664]|uniref:HAD family hydrolase n=1 Tax=Planctomicrobium sp. SH664 TaxID=3448125 RepID=UPI003F5AE349
MSLGLAEYIEKLDERKDLIWPQPPDPVPLKVSPSLAPLPRIKAVTWSVYGTLLNIDQGMLLHHHPQEIRMQIALDKTIREFNMWNSMSRKPGQPWEYMLRQYTELVEDARLTSTKKRGDIPEIDSGRIWRKILERLVKNDYVWDEALYGDLTDLSIKVAYFFHASLQGTTAAPTACEVLTRLMQAGIASGLLSDGQMFTLPQLVRNLRQQGPVRRPSDVLSMDLIVLSCQAGLKKPSESLFRQAVHQMQQKGIEPEQVLHVSHRLQDDLAVARRCGFHTALFAADKQCCHVTGADVRNPEWRPDRLVSSLGQILEILSI